MGRLRSSFAGVGGEQVSGAALSLATAGVQTGVPGSSWGSLRGSPPHSLPPSSDAGDSLQTPGDVQLRSSLCHQSTALIVQLVS